LRIPKLRKGSCFPSLLEPRRPADKALLAVVQPRAGTVQAYIERMSADNQAGNRIDQQVDGVTRQLETYVAVKLANVFDEHERSSVRCI
jgi:transposase-like protein